MALDPIFGDTRIDFEVSPQRPEVSRQGPPSRQTILLKDEDMNIRFIGYEINILRQWLWRIACVLSFGVLSLLSHWFPRLWLRSVLFEKAFKDIKQGYIVVETPYGDISLFALQSTEYPYPYSTVFQSKANGSESVTNGKAQETLSYLKVVNYRYMKYALNPESGLFEPVSDWRDTSWTSVPSVQSGANNTTRRQRLALFGPNAIDIEGKSVVSLLVDEIIHPFYVFQIASIVLWSLDDYYYYAFCIALISVLSVTSTLIETRKTIRRMREMSRFSCLINVLSEGKWDVQDSATLVPGDVVSISQPALSTFPADMLLLSGDAIVNESMLTGESVPVSKSPVKDAEIAKWKDNLDVTPECAKSFLYAGTRVVRVRGSVSVDGSAAGPAMALVVRTGFMTTKGALVRSMLFPKPLGFKFYRDSMRFIAVLTGIAGLGFMASAVQFVRLGVKWHTILVRALDLITVVVPPALPATLSIGTSFALSRLRKSGIFCISPNRVNVSGKVNVCCFDKTGTLTEDGLDILGVRGLERNSNRFGELIEDVHDLPLSAGKASFLHALATCHMLQVVEDEIMGDPLDVKMFSFTQWKLEEGHVAGRGIIKDKASGTQSSAALVQTIVRPPGTASFKLEDALKGSSRHAHFLELGVIRTFEFVSSLRRMSVVVKRLKSSSMEVYVKGAPEVMTDICDRDSLPDDYDDLLSYYTKRGYRVIAIAGKSIEGLTWLRAQRMKREQAESGLRFLGLIIFENKLKPGTTPAIQALRVAHMPCRMITGDNPLTAVSVARECGLINQAAHVFSPTFIQGDSTNPASKLRWTCTDDQQWILDDYSLKPTEPLPHHTVESANELSYHDYALVVTGDVFRWMINFAPFETLQRMLVKAQVFARMSPDEKNEVVERLQSLGFTVLMCGDGANDCAALKAADVGLSLSEAEASVAAPFTSQTPDISCVIEVIKEGRAALVTSFSCFKYMALYSLIQFTTITLLYSFASSLGDFQFLYIDLFIIIPIAVTMGRTLPYPQLHPKRPTASLVSKKVLASIIGQIILTSAAQFWVFFWIRGQPWYRPPGDTLPDKDSDKLQATNYENTSLFLVSCFQYILVAGVFSIGPPYRKSMWSNGLFMLAMSVIGLLNVWMLLFPPKPLAILLELMAIPFVARVTLAFVVLINIVLSTLYERWGSAVVADVVGFFSECFRANIRNRGGGVAYKPLDVGPR
ncbi:Ca-transporting ATPase [Schizopora paradoxa]|uniref:Cation-transporting ATPase n=1 Tax=Schizopora paradoxa TaxID=27342 RepID=A0A0H2SMW7_9AGAM|nr:Ca-transporting ATPase [Schizopora paradoxa]